MRFGVGDAIAVYRERAFDNPENHDQVAIGVVTARNDSLIDVRLESGVFMNGHTWIERPLDCMLWTKGLGVKVTHKNEKDPVRFGLPLDDPRVVVALRSQGLRRARQHLGAAAKACDDLALLQVATRLVAGEAAPW